MKTPWNTFCTKTLTFGRFPHYLYFESKLFLHILVCIYSTRISWCLCYEPCVALCASCPLIIQEIPILMKRVIYRGIGLLNFWGCLDFLYDEGDDSVSEDDREDVESMSSSEESDDIEAFGIEKPARSYATARRQGVRNNNDNTIYNKNKYSLEKRSNINGARGTHRDISIEMAQYNQGESGGDALTGRSHQHSRDRHYPHKYSESSSSSGSGTSSSESSDSHDSDDSDYSS